MERTFIMLKPDTLNRAIAGQIITRFEQKGLKLVGMKMLRLDDEVLQQHYAHLADKPFFPRILEFMKRSPVIAMVWEGKDVVEVVRKICGATNSREATPGTIRGDYSMSISTNIVHASDSKETAEAEVARFFKPEELFGWEQNNMKYLYASDEL